MTALKSKLISLALVLGVAATTACQPKTGTPSTTTKPQVTTTTAAPATTTTIVTSAPGQTTTIDFSGDSLDTSKWKPYHNTYGDGNKEMACLTPDNLIVSGGTLKIAAKKETVKCPSGAVRNYTSGFIGSRETGNYYPLEGRYEIRAKVPHAQGMWPAFWLRHRYGASTAEVDVMEYFHSAAPGRTSQTLHLAGQQNIAKTNDAFEAPTVSPGWHTWAVDIRKVEGNAIRFIFYTDGVETMRYVDYSAWKWNTADPNESWDMAVNMAVGGNWAGEPDGELGLLPNLNRCSTWGKFPPNCPTANIRRVDWNDPRTSTFEVDWVKHPS